MSITNINPTAVFCHENKNVHSLHNIFFMNFHSDNVLDTGYLFCSNAMTELKTQKKSDHIGLAVG